MSLGFVGFSGLRLGYNRSCDYKPNPLNPCSNLVFVLVSAQHGQGDDSGEEVHRQGLEAPHSCGEPAQRWGFHVRRVGQDAFLLCSQEGPDFPQRLQQVLERGDTAVPLCCRGRSASVLTGGEFCETVSTAWQRTKPAPRLEIPELSHRTRLDWSRNEGASAITEGDCVWINNPKLYSFV